MRRQCKVIFNSLSQHIQCKKEIFLPMGNTPSKHIYKNALSCMWDTKLQYTPNSMPLSLLFHQDLLLSTSKHLHVFEIVRRVVATCVQKRMIIVYKGITTSHFSFKHRICKTYEIYRKEVWAPMDVPATIYITHYLFYPYESIMLPHTIV